MRPILVWVTVWTAIPGSVTSQEVNRLHDVRWLLDAASVPMMNFSVLAPPVLVGAAGETATRAIWGEEREREEPLSSDRLVELVTTQFGFDSERDGRGRAVQFADGFLAVRAPEDGQQKVAAFLEFLERHGLEPVRIDLFVLPSESGRSLARAVLTAAEVEETLRSAPALQTITANARMGQSEVLEAVVRQSAVTDYDVEVAQETTAYDPLVQILLIGVDAVVRVDPVAGDRHLITFRARSAELNGAVPTGFTLDGAATPVSGDRFAFQANLSYQELPASPEVFPTRFKDIGSLDLPRIVALRTRSAPIVAAGRWTLFHASPLHGTDRHLVVLVRVTG